MTTETEAETLAIAKLSELEARLARARETAATNRTKAHDLAFAAEALDDDAAKRTSRKLIEDAEKIDADIAHRLEPAAREAKRRVAEARRAAADDAERVRAAAAKALAERLEGIGAARDAAFEQARTLGTEFESVMLELRRLGAPAPTRELVQANSTRALDAALAGLHPEARPVAPLQRHKFAALYRGWAEMTLGWAAKVLGTETREAA